MYEFVEEIDPVKDREISTNNKSADNEIIQTSIGSSNITDSLPELTCIDSPLSVGDMFKVLLSEMKLLKSDVADIKNTVISMESKVDGLANRVREV